MKNDVERWLEGIGEELLEHIGIKKEQKVLDFGCGGGNYAIPATITRVRRIEGNCCAKFAES